MTNKASDDTYLPKVRDRTTCYKENGALVIHEYENDNAWIAGKPVNVRR